MTATKLVAFEAKVDDDHNVMVMEHASLDGILTKRTLDCYVMYNDGMGHEIPYQFMYSLPLEQQTMEVAIQLAIDNAPDYYFLFEDR